MGRTSTSQRALLLGPRSKSNTNKPRREKGSETRNKPRGARSLRFIEAVLLLPGSRSAALGLHKKGPNHPICVIIPRGRDLKTHKEHSFEFKSNRFCLMVLFPVGFIRFRGTHEGQPKNNYWKSCWNCAGNSATTIPPSPRCPGPRSGKQRAMRWALISRICLASS